MEIVQEYYPTIVTAEKHAQLLQFDEKCQFHESLNIVNVQYKCSMKTLTMSTLSPFAAVFEIISQQASTNSV